MNRPLATQPDQAARARSLCDAGAWPDVLALAQQWLAENPADAKAFFYQGVALAAAGRFVEAVASYRRALALDEKDFKTWNNLAGILFDSLEQPAVRCGSAEVAVDPAEVT